MLLFHLLPPPLLPPFVFPPAAAAAADAQLLLLLLLPAMMRAALNSTMPFDIHLFDPCFAERDRGKERNKEMGRKLVAAPREVHR